MLFRSNDTATTEIYTHANTLSLHDALSICRLIVPPSLEVMARLGGRCSGWVGSQNSYFMTQDLRLVEVDQRKPRTLPSVPRSWGDEAMNIRTTAIALLVGFLAVSLHATMPAAEIEVTVDQLHPMAIKVGSGKTYGQIGRASCRERVLACV